VKAQIWDRRATSVCLRRSFEVISKWDDARELDLSRNHEGSAKAVLSKRLPGISRPHQWEENKTRAGPQTSRLVISLSPSHIRSSDSLHLKLLNYSLASWLPSPPVLSFLWRHRTFHPLVLILDRACTRDQVSQVTRALLEAGRYHSVLHFLLSHQPSSSSLFVSSQGC
jgi:hypothetical protein